MPIGESLALTAKIGKTGYDITKNSKIIERWIRRISYKMKHGSVILPVFGSGGTRKSTLPKFFTKSSNGILVNNSGYEISPTIEEVPLIGDIPGKILVGPGQERRVDFQWPELFGHIKSGRAQGMVNVVSYGYHSPDFKYIRDNNDLYEDGMPIDIFCNKYFASRKQRELDMLELILKEIGNLNRSFWFITLITKQDIWWHQRKEVKDYYENGEYYQKIQRYKSGLTRGHCDHEFIEVSLTLENLQTEGGEVLAKTAEGYDGVAYERSRVNAIRLFNGILSRGRLRHD